MAARKKLVSTICIISLILAITAGVLLSVGSQTNGGLYDVDNVVNLSPTNISVNASTATSGNGTQKPDGFPDDAVAISNQTTLESFLNGNATYGYITADFDLNWSVTGTNKALGAGRVIDGNGWTVKLKDDDGTANQYRDALVQHVGYTGGMNYGMFVAYNEGTIQNIKFK